MQVDKLLQEARAIWGDSTLSLEEVVVRMGVVLGDLNRLVRTKQETGLLDEAELKKELGNTIFSMIRWCDDLGFSPEECIAVAQQAQAAYARKQKGPNA